MADVISRLKLESGEFDSKIKRAAQGIQRMAEECYNAGGILNQLEDENREYIQSLGSMATVAVEVWMRPCDSLTIQCTQRRGEAG